MIGSTGKNVFYYSERIDTRKPSDIVRVIGQIDAILDELFNTAMKTVMQGAVAEYELDTGQTKTRVRYTTVKSITDAIDAYEKLRSLYVSKLDALSNGRSVQLVSQNNFRTRWWV